MARTVSQRGQARPTPEYGSRRCRVGGDGPESDHAPESGVAGWARSLPDQRGHLLTERGPDQLGVLVAVCGRRLPWSVGTSAQPTGCRCLTCEALAARPVTAPLGEREQRTQALRRGVAGAGQVVINPCGQLPATSVNPVSGPGLELVTSLVLQRVHGGG